jgi:hypothetical protein
MNSVNDNDTRTHIGPITDEIVDGLIKEFQRKKIKDKIVKHMIDPILCDIAEKYYTHVVTLMVILALMILLMISILIISLVPAKKTGSGNVQLITN